MLDGGADFSLVGIVDDKYFPPIGIPKYRKRKAVEMQLIVFLTERNMVEMMEILLRKRYLDIGTIDSYSRYVYNSKLDTMPYVSWLLKKQKHYEDPIKRKIWNALNYSKMIKLLQEYGAKTYQELEKENNITKGNKDGK